ncbi:MAG: hypothetical protein BroJett010_12420 [Gammaproteobacteria bacterium]|nr:DUF411 domain-containing protein [Gammaproteobacteria bacterium]QOJ32173.1 MAG: DUF411 domain-containing protein [Gammaproteobacteria bacterium]GIK34683.1 MAG: hypothetical protein BroJett010_12420 [Gammaproteobacteria bacterium]
MKYLQANGFSVTSFDVNDLVPLRQEYGIPMEVAGCHVARISGYLLEGHLSADEIRKLLTKKPNIMGLAIKGMPKGAPGMDGPGSEPYDVIAFQRNGATSVFASHTGSQEPPATSSDEQAPSAERERQPALEGK